MISHGLAPWLEPIWQKLEANLKQDRVPGAMLFQAVAGVAPETLIARYIAGLMCQNDASEPCGFCHSCGLIQSQSHPDVHFLVPDKDKTQLSVEQIRQANQWALESSQFGQYRVIVISHADTLTVAASNALLKTLEEPANHCLFILCAPSVKTLLPTIRSRCEVWSITVPKHADCIQWVNQQLGREVSLSSGYLCNFEPMTTLEFAEKGFDRDFAQLCQALNQFVEQGCIDAQAVWQVINKIERPVEVVLGWLWVLLYQAQRLALKESQQRNVLPESEPLASRFSYELLYQQTSAIAQLREQLLKHPGLNSELLICGWLYKFDR
ncbi:DNA polymerase III subunit delta' [Vibrio hippocampi]|uniref:DNA polymerase III subunit delta' n=1 Tax=Vibrio hippocampi TaxID=654686 RepID=A0ABN8DG89_9VIBR|nr:DNA polymerase III subunit delta' [Vibrio hippocampi]CAH0526529.1 DNA polymerase III subunit delta' [Vibrio hippocampi]